MTVTGHLRELRSRLFRSVLAFVVLSVICFVFIQRFVDAVLALSPEFSFVYLSPSELLTSYMKLSLILGLAFASPVILWEVWCFVRPGLTKREKGSVRTAVFAGFGFFLLGMAFCYFLILPLTLQFLYDFNGSLDIAANISFSYYMNFILGMLVAFGAVFEMPVLSYLLSRLGVLKPEVLAKARKYAILAVFLIAAIITPPDVLSQIMTAIPMLGLYELSIFVSRIAVKKRAAEGDEDEDEDEDEAEDDEDEDNEE